MSGKTISSNLELRLKGWKAALRSKKTPKWLRPSLEANVRRVSKLLARRRERKLV